MNRLKKANNSDQRTEDDDRAIGRALRASLLVFLLLGSIGGGIYLWLNRRAPAIATEAAPIALPETRVKSTAVIPTVHWTDITQAAGIDFVHTNGAHGEKLLPETMGAGVAAWDFDQDGDQDLLFINATPWPEDSTQSTPASTLALYQNDGHGNFVDVTADWGLDISLIGMGAACGDYDGDGRVDLFVSCVGTDHLFHNTGERFEDVSQAAGVAGDAGAWSSACGWFDYDRDGDLDLMVTHYVEWSREFDLAQNFRLLGGAERAYGRPQSFAGTYPSLFRNDGEGKFVDVSAEAGLQIQHAATAVPVAKSLGLAFEDLDGDQYLDCVISNDTVQNFLLHNQRDGRFEEIATMAGIAFDSNGAARGAMGIDIAPFRNDPCLAVAIGNFANEMSALYVCRGRDLQFYDAAIANGLGPATRLELTFAVFFFDFDLDGRLDLLQANGHLEQDIARVQASQHYEQSPQLFWHADADSSSEFVRCGESQTGPDFQRPMVGRGATYADFDGDGDLDVVIVGCGQPPRMLRNDQNLGHHWLRVKLIGSGDNPDAIGARIILTVGESRQERLVSPTRGYLSQVELPVTFGLGNSQTVERIHIRWPDGAEQEVLGPDVNQLLTIRQSTKPASNAGS